MLRSFGSNEKIDCILKAKWSSISFFHFYSLATLGRNPGPNNRRHWRRSRFLKTNTWQRLAKKAYRLRRFSLRATSGDDDKVRKVPKFCFHQISSFHAMDPTHTAVTSATCIQRAPVTAQNVGVSARLPCETAATTELSVNSMPLQETRTPIRIFSPEVPKLGGEETWGLVSRLHGRRKLIHRHRQDLKILEKLTQTESMYL